jgi:hypothetical protein
MAKIIAAVSWSQAMTERAGAADLAPLVMTALDMTALWGGAYLFARATKRRADGFLQSWGREREGNRTESG